MPNGALKLDWEVELGVIIGKTAHYVEESNALSHVAGYCVVNDVSEREFQIEGTGQWVKGKSHPSKKNLIKLSEVLNVHLNELVN